MNRLLLFDAWLTDAEFLELEKRAWEAEFGNRGRMESLRQFSFLAHYYAGEKILERQGKLDLFRRTQRLPDYRRAEDAIKRGWGRFLELECGISPDEERHPKKIVQQQLLYRLHRTSKGEARDKVLTEFAKKNPNTWTRPESDFMQRIGDAVRGNEREQTNTNDFAHVLLAHWLISFWWLMPLKAVAVEIARTQRQAHNSVAIQSFEFRLRKIRTRDDGAGGFFSKGWSGIFYSTDPPVIDSIEPNGTVTFTPDGKRLMA